MSRAGLARRSPRRVHLISDFNIEPLARLLENDGTAPECEVSTAPHGQVVQTLMAARPGKGKDRVAVIWARPEGSIGAFARMLNYEDVSAEAVLGEVETFADLLERAATAYRNLLVVSWAYPAGHRGYGMLDLDPNLGLANLLARMNLRLAERVAGMEDAFLIDGERWRRELGAKAGSAKLWLAGKVPYSMALFRSAALDLKSALRGIAGEARRLVVVDLDDTLWGGSVGEDGWRRLRLGGHDMEGEAFVEFQSALKGLTNRGVLLGIVSKNDEAVALEAVDKHPEMRLSRRDFSAWRIDWNDKAQNLSDLAAELGLGLASVVFIDNDAAERGRVREALPEVLVPDWPRDPANYAAALRGLRCFDTPLVSAEDRRRGCMYAAERSRRESRAVVSTLDDWLKSLDLSVRVESLSPSNSARATQLFNKTNQMNLGTRRLSQSELVAWQKAPGHKLWVFSVADRFGDYGLSGIVGIEERGTESVRIVDFLLSCRVMGRKVEQCMLHVVVEYARRRGRGSVEAVHSATERNGPCLEIFRASGFVEREPAHFTWNATQAYAKPAIIKLEYSGPDSAVKESAVRARAGVTKSLG